MRRLPILVAAVSWLAACSGGGSTSATTSARSDPLSSDGVNATLRVQSDWKSGYCADVTLENTGAAAVTSWTVVVDLHQSTLTNSWNGAVSTSGSQITVTPTAGNGAIAAGGSLNAFGFCGSATGTTYLPELVSLVVVGGGGGGGTSDFALSANPSGGTLPQGTSGSSTITIDRRGYTGSVALAVSGVPAGVTATLDPATTTGTTSTLTVAVSSSAAPGTSTLTVTGTGGGVTRTTQLALTVSGSPTDRVENPFAGASFYVDPQWAAKVRDAATRAGDLSAAVTRVASQPSAFWLDRIAAIDGTSTSLGLAGHLDEALKQQATEGGGPMVVAMIVYDLPDRDCAAFASNGELHASENGLARYEAEYIDHIVQVLLSNPAYQQLRIVAVVEPDALPNIVTNMSLPACSAAAPTYREGVAYAVQQLAKLSNVYLYLDLAHSAWLGWEHPDEAATVYNQVLTAAGGADLVRGFATNVANYSALQEPFNPYDNQNQYNDLIVNFYEWNRMIDEVTYVDAMRARFPNHHFIIDTGRNGWPARAAGLPIENRTHRGNWCNIEGAGLGERPRADPMDGVDAYYWLKPPGESDGTSDATQTTPDAEGKRYDPMCGPDPVVRPYSNGEAIPTDALQGAPPAGHWFEGQFFMLVRNATPAF